MIGLGNKPLPWFDISSDSMEVNCSDPERIFYNDMPKEEAAKYAKMLKPHSYATFSSQMTAEPWRKIPSTYIVCEDDKAIPLQGQLGMIEQAKSMAEGSKLSPVPFCVSPL